MSAIPVLPVRLAADGVWEASGSPPQSLEDIDTVASLDGFTPVKARVRVDARVLELTVHRSEPQQGYVKLADVPADAPDDEG